MKKIILFLALMLLTIMSVYGFTDITSITNITSGSHPAFTFSGIALCYEAGDLIYCGYSGDDPSNLYIFNPATETWSNTSSSFASKIYYENHACEEYNGDSYVYCASKDWTGDTTFTMLRMDDDGNNVFNLNVTNEPENVYLASYSCEIRPDTDEFWCVLRGQSGDQLYVTYYDIGDDIFNVVYSDLRPQYRIDGAWNDYGQGCTWDGTGENFYCSGGTNQDSSFEANRSQALAIYNVATNTSTYEDMPVIASDGEFGGLHQSRVAGDTLWMYGFETAGFNEMVDTIVYYNIDLGMTAISPTTLLTEYTAELGGCVKYNESTDYCLMGYADEPFYNEFADVWRIDFEYTVAAPSAPAAAAVEDDENIGGNIIALQNLQRSQRAAVTPVNPITQFILNLRAAILRLFGIEP